ncbi:MAG: polymer-forming cytoskeletal protein [Anaerolineales bacterium]|nr:polymer-forming cytoskeletal protein [Anaerolineales bacterium]
MRKLFVILVLAFGLTLAPLFNGSSIAQAAPFHSDEVVTGGDFILRSGETLEGNLIVVGGNVVVEKEAVVTGQVVIFGGDVMLSGTVHRDVVVFGGNLELSETAVVKGNLVRSGGSVRGEEGYEVQGSEIGGFAAPPLTTMPPTPTPSSATDPLWGLVRQLFGFVWNSLIALTTAIAVGLLALLVVLLLPEQTRRVSAAISTVPVLSGGIGLLTLFAVPFLAIVLALATLLCFSPFSLLALIVYGIAVLFGWIAVGALLGERLAASARWQNVGPAFTAALGTFLLTLLTGGLGLLPGGGFLGALVGLLAASVGLGAVTLTRFGTQPYLGALPSMPAPPMSDVGRVVG